MMTDDEILKVVQAHKEGKRIQFRYKHCSGWAELPKLGWRGWDFMDYEYRVAPEPRKPREWILHIPDAALDKETQVRMFPSNSSGHNFGYVDGSQCVRVREVIE